MVLSPRRLVDVEAVRQLNARYFRLIAQKRWDEMRRVFTADVGVRTPDDTGDDSPIRGNDAFEDMLISMIGEPVTVDHGHMSEITFDADNGDKASGVWAMEDHLWWPPE